MNLMNEVLNALNLGVVLIDHNRKVIFLNNWIEDKTKVLFSNVANQPLEDIFPRFQESRYLNVISSVQESKHGRFLSGSIHGMLFSNPLQENSDVDKQNVRMECLSNGYVLIYVEDVSQRFKEQREFKKFIKQLAEEKDTIKLNEEKERQLARTDALTGLNNRLALNSYLEEKLLQAKIKSHGKKLVVYFIDMDDFKDVNDTYGHKYGDLVLIEVAKRLQKAVRHDDFVARISGDEFVIVVVGELDEAQQGEIADKIVEAFSKPVIEEDKTIEIAASIGISKYRGEDETVEEILDRADQALYKSKKSGKGTYTIYR